MRNHKNYFGLSKTNLTDASTNLTLPEAFLVISEINIFDWSIHWTYEAIVKLIEERA